MTIITDWCCFLNFINLINFSDLKEPSHIIFSIMFIHVFQLKLLFSHTYKFEGCKKRVWHFSGDLWKGQKLTYSKRMAYKYVLSMQYIQEKVVTYSVWTYQETSLGPRFCFHPPASSLVDGPSMWIFIHFHRV